MSTLKKLSKHKLPHEKISLLLKKSDDDINELVSLFCDLSRKYNKLADEYNETISELNICKKTVKLYQVE